MTPTRVLIVDDEPLARRFLREMLVKHDDIEVVGEADTGPAAIQHIRNLRPDLVLLDVQMPEMDGLAVVEALGEDLPVIVFVTAYDEYAVRAFEVEALDYLLKPFDEERLARALARARERLRTHEPGTVAASARHAARREAGRAQHRSRMPVHADGAVKFIETGSIDWIEADGKVIHIHRGKDRLTTRQPLSDIEDMLDPDAFVRVHRSAIVNLQAIVEIQPWFHGDFVMVLRNGARVTTGRSYRTVVRGLIGR